MRAYVDLGCAPWGEDCAQVGSPEYAERSHRECRAYIRQLRRAFGPEPEGAKLAIRANPHDFGIYYSVVCYYHPKYPDSDTYAFRCENESPEHWDNQARQELAGEGSDHESRHRLD
jgi:hypothetical protein